MRLGRILLPNRNMGVGGSPWALGPDLVHWMAEGARLGLTRDATQAWLRSTSKERDEALDEQGYWSTRA